MYTYVKFFQLRNESKSRLTDQSNVIMRQGIAMVKLRDLLIKITGAKSQIRPEVSVIKPPQMSQLR